MNNTVPKLSPKQYEENFSELHPAFTQNQAVAEANRCLYCYDSPCMKACPTHIDISTFIKKIATGNVKGSAKTILESNWLALTCAKACPVSELCEGACVYNERGEKPIEIGRLQRYAMDKYFEMGMPSLFRPKQKNGKSVGVIGAGPAGLACAAELALLGYDVTIYEGKEQAGGLSNFGIAPYKMKFQDSLNEIKLIESFGVKIQTGVWIGKDMTFGELEQKHDALFLGMGLGLATKLNIPGEDLNGVVDANEFIEKVTRREWHAVDVGKKVVVIGGGNTAIDAATEAKRLGAKRVTILYRRGVEDMPAYKFEQELAKLDDVIFHFLAAPKRILGNASVESVECLRMKLGKREKGGKRKVQQIGGSEFQLKADMVIKAVGQSVNISHLFKIADLKTQDGNVWVNPKNMQTSNPKYFAGGDCINGGKEVVNAAADGKKAAHGIDTMLLKKSAK
ncbi:MAG: NAD(P)-dependent oxidoreductase [Ignavibacteriae bacterium]|nr:NAD(P)-dependent oxidoreductase [Ignavibacteriota bacterium]